MRLLRELQRRGGQVRELRRVGRRRARVCVRRGRLQRQRRRQDVRYGLCGFRRPAANPAMINQGNSSDSKCSLELDSCGLSNKRRCDTYLHCIVFCTHILLKHCRWERQIKKAYGEHCANTKKVHPAKCAGACCTCIIPRRRHEASG